MHKHASFALAHPVYDPQQQIVAGHFWLEEPRVSACLTVNIGQEWSRYADGRPLWQLSLAARSATGPVQVLSWSATTRRRIEHVRDRILRGLGTDEPLIEEVLPGQPVSVNWRKPLSISEVAQLAQTPEVVARPGRP